MPEKIGREIHNLINSHCAESCWEMAPVNDEAIIEHFKKVHRMMIAKINKVWWIVR